MNFVKCVLDWINKKNKYAKINVKFCFPIYANVESFLQKKKKRYFYKDTFEGNEKFLLGSVHKLRCQEKGQGVR